MTLTSWILVALAVAILLAVAIALSARSRGGAPADEAQEPHEGRPRPPRAAFGDHEHGQASRPEEKRRPRAAVIVNPTKFDDIEKVRSEVFSVCAAEGWDEPLWIETSKDDPGCGQTQQALDAGVDLVCPLGGDGTVRSVGDVLRGHQTPMGLLPGGTGNLLARNLDLPIDSVEKALRVALTGRNKPIDVGTMKVVEGEQPKEYAFLVMAGMGFDADIMASTDEDLKAKVGWAAYLVSGAQHLVGPRFHARVTTDDESISRRTRSIIVGNVGKLQGGVTLMPDAVVDDGRLDVLVLSPRGIVGWGAVAVDLATRHHRGHKLVDHHTSTRLTVTADRPVQLQIDGDPLDKATKVEFGIEHRALVVRVPATTTGGSTARA